jgi:hypothetical protein
MGLVDIAELNSAMRAMRAQPLGGLRRPNSRSLRPLPMYPSSGTDAGGPSDRLMTKTNIQ